MKALHLPNAQAPPASKVKDVQKAPPDESEWCFDDVPDDEVELCFLYEYGRRAEQFCQQVDDWRVLHWKAFQVAKRLLNCRTAAADASLPPPGKKKARAEAREAEHVWASLTPSSLVSFRRSIRPEELTYDDPRVFLYFFPPFPKYPWQKIEPRAWRHNAYLWLRRDLLWDATVEVGGRTLPCPLRPWEKVTSAWTNKTKEDIADAAKKSLTIFVMLASRDFSNQEKEAGDYLKDDSLSPSSLVRRSVGAHLFAPPVMEGYDLDEWLSPNWFKTEERRGPLDTRRLIWGAGVCHEEVQLRINWAKSDGAIKRAFADWLKRQKRPHDSLKEQNLKNARRHLHHLGILRLRDQGFTDKEVAEDLGLCKSDRQARREAKNAKAILSRLFPR